MLLGLIFVLCLASVPLLRGRLSALADVPLRHGWLLLAALAVQVVIISIAPEGDATARQAAHLGSYAGVLAFVWLNRAVPGLALAGAGALLNVAAIAANGGVMPASPEALEAAGLASAAGFENSAAVADARLAALGDVFAVPASWPASNVFSLGDVVLVLGVLTGLHRICGSRAGAWRPALLVPRPLSPVADPKEVSV